MICSGVFRFFSWREYQFQKSIVSDKKNCINLRKQLKHLKKSHERDTTPSLLLHFILHFQKLLLIKRYPKL